MAPPFPILQPSQFLQICEGGDKSALILTINHCAKRLDLSCTAPEGGRVIWAGTVVQNLPRTTEMQEAAREVSSYQQTLKRKSLHMEILF